MNSISDIKHAFYINLHCRPDRKQHVENQLTSIGINAERFNAIKMSNGAIGCSMSHLKIIENAKANKASSGYSFLFTLPQDSDCLFWLSTNVSNCL